MKIQSKEITVEQAQDLALALGYHLGKLDDQRNTRAATADEVRDFCFGPAKEIYLAFVTKRALAQNPLDVTPLDA